MPGTIANNSDAIVKMMVMVSDIVLVHCLLSSQDTLIEQSSLPLRATEESVPLSYTPAEGHIVKF